MPSPRVDRPDRRSFLRHAAVGGAVTVGTALVPVARFLPAAAAQGGTEEDLAAFGESMELVAVAAYERGIELLSEDLAPVLQTFRGHHQEHAEAFAALAGSAATGEANPALLEALTPAIDALSTQNEVLRFARDLENQLAATCGHLLTLADGSDHVSTIGTILPTEASHAAELSYELQEGPDGWFPAGPIESADITFGFDPSVFPVSGP
ncbi:ferritin-like domain-containing protein [Acidimicrobiia bacterium EGI L10123]|uniref:ferritin-like domain-containing protein n=1 Tax=Salinilacustrithrix flava TaxID=2957203 RepID=UPI003D7C3581|nr:ferritin-like domain-containing protein [Acidimicrobiia bacterium EGI L10123]